MCPMVEAAYLHRQAELCFAIADLMSDPVGAKLARVAAEHYVQRAKKAEEEQVFLDPPAKAVA